MAHRHTHHSSVQHVSPGLYYNAYVATCRFHIFVSHFTVQREEDRGTEAADLEPRLHSCRGCPWGGRRARRWSHRKSNGNHDNTARAVFNLNLFSLSPLQVDPSSALYSQLGLGRLRPCLPPRRAYSMNVSSSRSTRGGTLKPGLGAMYNDDGSEAEYPIRMYDLEYEKYELIVLTHPTLQV